MAASSGLAFSRGFQKLNDFLSKLAREDHCGRSIHLLCHSMGNFVLENTLWHLRKNLPGRLPRIFSEVNGTFQPRLLSLTTIDL